MVPLALEGYCFVAHSVDEGHPVGSGSAGCLHSVLVNSGQAGSGSYSVNPDLVVGEPAAVVGLVIWPGTVAVKKNNYQAESQPNAHFGVLAAVISRRGYKQQKQNKC